MLYHHFCSAFCMPVRISTHTHKYPYTYCKFIVYICIYRYIFFLTNIHTCVITHYIYSYLLAFCCVSSLPTLPQKQQDVQYPFPTQCVQEELLHFLGSAYPEVYHPFISSKRHVFPMLFQEFICHETCSQQKPRQPRLESWCFCCGNPFLRSIRILVDWKSSRMREPVRNGGLTRTCMFAWRGWLEEKSCNDLVDSFKLELVPKGTERF